VAQVQTGHRADCSNPHNVVAIRIRFSVYLCVWDNDCGNSARIQS
jgi:hypothetical protein